MIKKVTFKYLPESIYIKSSLKVKPSQMKLIKFSNIGVIPKNRAGRGYWQQNISFLQFAAILQYVPDKKEFKKYIRLTLRIEAAGKEGRLSLQK